MREVCAEIIIQSGILFTAAKKVFGKGHKIDMIKSRKEIVELDDMKRGIATRIIIVAAAIVLVLLVYGYFTNFGTSPLCYTKSATGQIDPCFTGKCGQGIQCPAVSANATSCTQDSDCIPVCDSWCGNVNYYQGIINCPMIPTNAAQPKCACQNNQCTKV